MVEKLKAKPVAPGRYDIVVDPSQLFLAIHESVGHSTELDRSLGWEANMAGTSFLKPADAGKLRFGANIVNLVGDRTQPGGLATTGFDDEGVKAERWHLVRDGMFVDWQTTRELAPLVGQQRSHGCLHCRQLVERAVPADAERLAASRRATEVSLDDLFSGIKRGLFIEGRGSLVDRSAALQLPVRRRGDSRDHERQARRDGAGTRRTSRGRRTSGRRATASAGPRPIGSGARPPTARASPARPTRSATAVRRRASGNVTVLNTAAVVMLNRDEALKICETVLAHAKAAGAEDATVSLQSSVESHARFADNRITTSGRAEDLDITATVWVGRRRGSPAATMPRRRARSSWPRKRCRSRACRRCIANTCRRSARSTTPRVARLRRRDGGRRSRRARDGARSRAGGVPRRRR